MFGEFVRIFPISTCVSMFLLLVFSKIDSNQKKSLLVLLSALALFFVLEVVYSAEYVDYMHLANAYLLAQLIVPSLVPAAWKLYLSMTDQKSSKYLSGIWLIIPIVIFSLSLIVRYILGIDSIIEFHRLMDVAGTFPALLSDRIYKVYYLNTFIVFYIVVFLEILYFLFYLVTEMKRTEFSLKNVFSSFISYKYKDNTHLVQFSLLVVFLLSTVRVCLSRSLILTYIYVDYLYLIFMSVAIIYLTCIVMFSIKTSPIFENHTDIDSDVRSDYREKKISDYFISATDDSDSQIDNSRNLLELQAIDLDQDSSVSKVDDTSVPTVTPVTSVPPVSTTHQPTQSTVDKPVPATSFSSPQVAFIVKEETDEDSLTARFEHLLFKEKIFLQPGLTIVDVADKLRSNKTYISRIVNSNYGMSFPDFINSLRIDYAEQYILHNESAKQKDVAEACGFPSASAFNNTFKKITGMTPKIWMAANHINK